MSPSAPPPRAPRRALLPGLLLLAIGCRGDAAGPADPTAAAVAGAYVLRSVSGLPLPAAIVGTSSPVVVSRATRTLNADGTCSEVGSATRSFGPGPAPGGGPPAPVVVTGTLMTCTWTLRGRVVTFHVVSQVFGGEFGYDATTTAAYADDGTLTEANAVTDGTHLYPRVFGR